MPSLNQGQVGTLKSIPKLTRINGDDVLKLVYRNMGNNHAYPFLWGSTHELVSGAATVVASGIKFHGMDLASYANVVATVSSGTADGYIYVTKDTTLNTVTITSTGSNSVEVDVQWMLGVDPSISGLYCRGFGNPAQSLP